MTWVMVSDVTPWSAPERVTRRMPSLPAPIGPEVSVGRWVGHGVSSCPRSQSSLCPGREPSLNRVAAPRTSATTRSAPLRGVPPSEPVAAALLRDRRRTRFDARLAVPRPVRSPDPGAVDAVARHAGPMARIRRGHLDRRLAVDPEGPSAPDPPPASGSQDPATETRMGAGAGGEWVPGHLGELVPARSSSWPGLVARPVGLRRLEDLDRGGRPCHGACRSACLGACQVVRRRAVCVRSSVPNVKSAADTVAEGVLETAGAVQRRHCARPIRMPIGCRVPGPASAASTRSVLLMTPRAQGCGDGTSAGPPLSRSAAAVCT